MGSLGVGLWAWGFAAYVAGVVWGLIMIDARPAARIGLALLWPVGPLAFVLTIAVLLGAALIAYPALGAAALLAAGLAWWVSRLAL